jgi:hypothetical protein
MPLRFQKTAVRGNYETENQAFSMRLRFLTIRDTENLVRSENTEVPEYSVTTAHDQHIYSHILRMPGISQRPPDLLGLIYHQHTQSNDFWIGAATRTNLLTIRQQRSLGSTSLCNFGFFGFFDQMMQMM